MGGLVLLYPHYIVYIMISRTHSPAQGGPAVIIVVLRRHSGVGSEGMVLQSEKSWLPISRRLGLMTGSTTWAWNRKYERIATKRQVVDCWAEGITK